MYKTIITFKSDVPMELLYNLNETAEKAFNNRAGKASNKSKSLEQCIFEGNDELNTCLQLGNCVLNDEEGFKNNVKAWNWIDTEVPDENDDILKTFAEIEAIRAN
jgi:hypothetical protein